MPKCKLCGFRLADEAAKCSICGAMPRSTKARELLNAAHLSKYLCPSCKAEIIGEHRYCPACMKELSEAAKKADVQEQGSNDCIQCGVSLPVGAKFCHECGAKQENHCTHCGATIMPNAKFCHECGAKQEAAPNAKPTKENGTNVSGGLKETPLDAFEYEVCNGKYILKGVKDNSLTDVVIPRVFSEIEGKVDKDGKWIGVFSACKKLKSVTVPNSVNKIGKHAFCDCHSLTNVTIPDSVTEIGMSAFSHCYSLTNVTIPNSVIEIEGCAFSSCNSLKSITVPKSVKIIGKDAFAGCNSLKNVSFENPNMTKSDIKRVFGDSPSFKEVKIGNKVVHLD